MTTTSKKLPTSFKFKPLFGTKIKTLKEHVGPSSMPISSTECSKSNDVVEVVQVMGDVEILKEVGESSKKNEVIEVLNVEKELECDKGDGVEIIEEVGSSKKQKKKRKTWREYKEGRSFNDEWMTRFWWAMK